MTQLLAKGINLRAAKRYLDNKEEQAHMEQSMKHGNNNQRGQQLNRDHSLYKM